MKTLELEQIKALELLLTGHDVQCCDSANRLWKELHLSSALFGKAFTMNPNVSVSVTSSLTKRSTALQRNYVKFLEYVYSWPFCPSFERLNWTSTWNFRMLLAPRISQGHFFLVVFFRITYDGLSKRGTARRLSQVLSAGCYC